METKKKFDGRLHYAGETANIDDVLLVNGVEAREIGGELLCTVCPKNPEQEAKLYCTVEKGQKVNLYHCMKECAGCKFHGNLIDLHILFNPDKDFGEKVAKNVAIDVIMRLKGGSPELVKMRTEAAKRRKKPSEEAELASDERCGAVYKAMLNHCTLDPMDHADLKRRGFTDSFIKWAGFKSAPRDPRALCRTLIKEGFDLAGVPGFYQYTDKSGELVWTLSIPGDGYFCPIHRGDSIIRCQFHPRKPEKTTLSLLKEHGGEVKSKEDVVGILKAYNYSEDLIKKIMKEHGYALEKYRDGFIRSCPEKDAAASAFEQIKFFLTHDGQKYSWISSAGKKNGCGSGSPCAIMPGTKPYFILAEGTTKGLRIKQSLPDVTVVSIAGTNSQDGLKAAFEKYRGTFMFETIDMDKCIPVSEQPLLQKMLIQASNERASIEALSKLPEYKAIEKHGRIQHSARLAAEKAKEFGIETHSCKWDLNEEGLWNGEYKGLDDYFEGNPEIVRKFEGYLDYYYKKHFKKVSDK